MHLCSSLLRFFNSISRDSDWPSKWNQILWYTSDIMKLNVVIYQQCSVLDYYSKYFNTRCNMEPIDLNKIENGWIQNADTILYYVLHTHRRRMLRCVCKNHHYSKYLDNFLYNFFDETLFWCRIYILSFVPFYMNVDSRIPTNSSNNWYALKYKSLNWSLRLLCMWSIFLFRWN